MIKARKEGLAALVVVLVAVLAFSAFYFSYFVTPGNGSRAVSTSEFRNGTASGLKLSLQVTPAGNGSYAIGVEENSTMAGDQPVQAAGGWAYPQSSLDPFDGCGAYSSLPIGVAILPGHYTIENYSQAESLVLYNTKYAFTCTMYAYPIAQYVFVADGYKATMIDSQSHVLAVANMTIHLSTSGYWTGGAGTSQPATFHTFRGEYTVLAADEWGALDLQYFAVR